VTRSVFDHVQSVSKTLVNIHAALKANGKLFSEDAVWDDVCIQYGHIRTLWFASYLSVINALFVITLLSIERVHPHCVVVQWEGMPR
jgi:hypothetical protein